MTANLMVHAGAHHIERHELDRIDAPPPTASWFPVRHSDVIDAVTRTLGHGNYRIEKQSFAVSHDNARMFATMDLASRLQTGVSLAIGIRNSCDKSFPMGFCAGNRVFVCDNLAFSAELMVKRKHTRFGQDRFKNAIIEAVSELDQFQKAETLRIKHMQQRLVTDTEAESLILRSYERKIIPHHKLESVINEWRTPSFDFGDAPDLWRLFNAFTTVLGNIANRNPQRHALLTIDLHDMLSPLFPKQLAIHKEPEHASAA